MRLFIALVVFSVGVGLYAVAALLFDRRRVLRGWQAARRARTTGGGAAVTAQSVNVMPLYLTIAGCLLGGTLLMVGACAGVIVW
jgi:hypothetical protein